MFLELILVFIIIIVTSFNYIVTEKPPWGVVNKVLYCIVLSWHAKFSLPVSVRVSKTRVLKLPNRDFKIRDATAVRRGRK